MTNNSLQAHLDIVKSLSEQHGKETKIALVSGNFNVVHPGHLRLLKFAADCSDILVVAVLADGNPGVLIPAELRLDNVKDISFVSHAFIVEQDIPTVIETLKPNLVVKGKEHQTLHNIEAEPLEKIGGKLLFSSGDAVFSSIDLIREESRPSISKFDLNFSHKYLNRHGIYKERLVELVTQISKLNVLVIGDLIIDEYVTCDVLGVSREDPTVVVTPVHEQKFIGGAGIVASHARGLGANTSYLTVAGDDQEAKHAIKKISDYGVDIFLVTDQSRPTTLKQRFRSSGKTLLRVSKLKQHAIDAAIQDQLFDRFIALHESLDLLVFSDFNYGALPQSLVDRIINVCKSKNIPMVADSQSSSQIGNIARFHNMQLIKPTEIEARLAVQDHDSGLVGIADALAKKSEPDHILLTLGPEGVLIQSRHPELSKWITDRLPAFCNSPRDPAGAGDAMLVSASLALACGASIWEAAYIGSIASGCQVATVGNTPLTAEDLIQEINTI
ncbi:PfkB family carbohydrate kinase [Sneathiella glossodoripedis]|uniref:PfkB family carbohydrate kinase n=1 Tax=Sneathiella glossodoripedis TaxID=418853 RepID=UPI0004729844|nr:PfkB family carbohydrate kinase [Sneathiella glossodoripedis]